MLAGEHFGRRHHRRLPPRFDDLGHCDQRDNRLAGSDIALEEPDHALFRFEIGANLLDRLALSPGQRKRQRRLETPAERALGDMRAPRESAHPRPHQKERELVRQKLVIGEPGGGGSGRVDVSRRRRPVHRSKRLLEARQLHQVQRFRADPLGQARQALQRALGRARDRALKEALGQAIDRLDRRQAGELVRVHDAIRVDDLVPPVPALELAGNPAGRTDGQARAHPGMISEKEHKLDVAGLVLDQHRERRARARIWRLAMLGDFCLDGDDRVGNGVTDLGPRAPVERGVGQVEQHIHHPRAFGLAEQPVEELCVLWPDPRQRSGRREQRIEKGGAHGRAL